MDRRLLVVVCGALALTGPAVAVESSPGLTATAPIREDGRASYYAERLAGRRTASGARYDPAALTAAHRTLPLGTRVRVVNPKNERSVVVTVNDRGPVSGKRMIDLSSAAANHLGIRQAGTAHVRTEVVPPADAARPAPRPAAAANR